MPLYEYECAQCHERTERIQKFSDPEITVCPYCSGHLERVLSAPAVTFKGGGWYADGYGNPKPKSTESSKPSDTGTSSSANPPSPAPSSTPASSTPAPAATSTASSSSDK